MTEKSLYYLFRSTPTRLYLEDEGNDFEALKVKADEKCAQNSYDGLGYNRFTVVNANFEKLYHAMPKRSK